ncbi:uncharacterized protein LOC126968037 [Leptidea sinapis]|uniref:uncharacterized protein LOC126968037 n=1 Tax=Leptidea sinapis TaxID=189913 RepID=UPI0021233007|nr:uncharacterized protein LOC126968037 [Leptidea sinapis]
MNDPQNSNVPEPRKVGVWTEGVPAIDTKPKDIVISKKSPEILDDIPTIPDLDDLQDIFEKELSQPPISDRKDKDTVKTLAEVSDGITGTAEGIDATLEVLMSHIPILEPDSVDTVWTVESLLTQLAEESEP